MDGLVRGDLLKVPALVADVVLDEEAEGYGGFVADDTGCLEPVGRDAIDDGDEDFVLGPPPGEQGLPGLGGIPVRRHPGLLRVEGTGIRSLC